MPEIIRNTEKLNIIKPEAVKADVGDSVTVNLTGVHLDNDGMLSVPAIATFKDKSAEGHFPLNTTNYRKIAAVLGTNSDSYEGATFVAVCIPRQNPNTKAEVLSWSIKDGSVKKA